MLVNFFLVAPAFLSGIAFYVAVQHIFLYFGTKKAHREYLTFALTCFIVGLYDVACVGLYTSTSIVEGAFWQLTQFRFADLMAVSFLWFFADYAHYSKRKLIYFLTVCLIAVLIINVTGPGELSFVISSPKIKSIQFGPFLSIIYYEVAEGPLTDISEILFIVGIMFCFWMAFKQYWNRTKKESLSLLLMLALFAFGIVNDTAVSLDLYSSIYLLEYTYIGAIVLMANTLSKRSKADQVKYVDQILKASTFKSEFMATMSHELRTPLNSIMGFSELLSEQEYFGKLSDQQLEFVQNISSSSEHLLHLVNQFLDIAKIESGKLKIDIRPVVLNELVNELVMELKPEYLSKGLELNLQGFEQQRIIFADPVQLKQILLNLISNAIKYTLTGSITIQFLEREDSFEINVTDTGIGIAEKDFSKVFKEFERIETPKITSNGSGLGLALTKRLVNIHGGEVSFTSKEGVGSTFTFTLPKTLKSFIEVRGDDTMPAELSTLETIEVLLIEDNKNDINIIQKIIGEIKNMNFKIHPEMNLTDGINYLKNHEEINLILLDLLLPESEGLETAQTIIDLNLKIPVIILTVVDDKILAAEAIRRGVQDYLIKSEINPNSMERSIRLAFERYRMLTT